MRDRIEYLLVHTSPPSRPVVRPHIPSPAYSNPADVLVARVSSDVDRPHRAATPAPGSHPPAAQAAIGLSLTRLS
jgi:hypothetical protein